ncbi:MAG: acyl-CoA dehydrogenase family protein [Actinomycetota bacterium]
MDLRLPEQTIQLASELQRFSARRAERLGDFDGFDLADWKELASFGLPGITQSGGTDVDLVVAIMEGSRAGLPGPVVEAQMALDSGCAEAVKAVARGAVVTSLPPGSAGNVVVGWGAVADLVVDQGTGTVLATGPLPAARTSYLLPHGWISRPAAVGWDRMAPRRWLLGAAALEGLGRGALSMAAQHAESREQFGQPLSSFQAVQFRLAECLNLLEGLRLGVLDAAWRANEERPDAPVAAALTWLWADQAAERIVEHVHQVFGALGFCFETGLVQLTSQMSWSRLSIGRRDAVRFVADRRSRTPGVPPSTVLAGFEGDANEGLNGSGGGPR